MAAEAAEGAGERAAASRRARRARQRARDAGTAYAGQARQVARGAQLAPGRSAHQGAILAEFLTAMVIIIVAPIAKPESGNVGVSPYAARDLKRIGAVGAVYFGLALVPGENGSRVAAWLGGLVLLIIAMRAVSSGELKSIVDIFSAGGTQPPGATTGPSSPGTAPPPGGGAVPV